MSVCADLGNPLSDACPEPEAGTSQRQGSCFKQSAYYNDGRAHSGNNAYRSRKSVTLQILFVDVTL